MAELTGRAAVLDALTGDESPVQDPEQLDLLGLPSPAPGRDVVPYRGRGRPPGARNRRVQEWADYLLGRYSSPLEVLAQIATAPVEALAAQLHCGALEALAEKRLAAIALLPYLHQRQPVAVDLNARQVVNLTIVEAAITPDDGAGAHDLTLTDAVVEVLENQQISRDAHGAL